MIRFYLLSAMLVSNSIFSILEIEILKGSDNLSKIAFVPFGVEDGVEEDYGMQISQYIEKNMLLFGEFENLDKSEMLSYPSSENEFFYRDWKVLGVDYSVIGRVNSVNALGNLNISYSLFNITRRIKILEGEIVGSEDNMLNISKIISNRIYKKITGLRGIFDTKLAYVINSEADTYQMCISDIDGKNEQILFTSKTPIMSPDWSPDRKKIAYVSFENGLAEIFIQDLKSGKRESIQALGMTNSAPVWSPDGKSLAMVVSFSGNPDIFLYSISNKRLIRLTNHYGIDTEPSWSPDSKKIIFTSDRSGSPQLYEINTKSKRKKRLTRDGNYNARGRYFPDGKSIFFVHGNDGNFQIARKKLSSRYIETLTSTSLDESPTISPNGNIIIYATKDGSNGYLGGITLDGKARFSIPVKNGSVREPAWSPIIN